MLDYITNIFHKFPYDDSCKENRDYASLVSNGTYNAASFLDGMRAEVYVWLKKQQIWEYSFEAFVIAK